MGREEITADDADHDGAEHGDNDPYDGDATRCLDLAVVANAHEAHEHLRHAEVSQAPAQGRDDGEQTVLGGNAKDGSTAKQILDAVGIDLRRSCLHHREIAGDVGEERRGVLDATCHGDGADDDDRQGKEHEAALHEVGCDNREVAADHRVEEYDDGAEDHHNCVVHAKERVEELAAGDEAAARIDAEEDENDDGGNRAHNVLVIVKAVGVEAR